MLTRLRAIKGLGLLLIGLVAGVILLLLGGKTDAKQSTASIESEFSFEEYEKALAVRLEEMIERLEGVSEVHVMVTLDRSYADELAGESGDYLTIRKSDGEQGTVTISRNAPKVKGVAVICKGGNSSEKQKEIISMLSALLELPTHRIFVSEG
jgi:stage III sporulation protein AG